MPQFDTVNIGSLPKQFLIAMKTLFDIMDDDRTGFVKFSDIEIRWRDNGTKGLPKGLIECLKSITPRGGLLSFDQFCSGLKICLLKNQADEARLRRQNITTITDPIVTYPHFNHPQFSQAEHSIEADVQQGSQTWSLKNQVAVSSMGGDMLQTELNFPRLGKEESTNQLDNPEYYFNSDNFSQFTKMPYNIYGPPKPPRSAIGLEKNGMITDQSEPRDRTKWQMTQSVNNINLSPKEIYSGGVFVPNSRGTGDGKPACSVDPPTNIDQSIDVPSISDAALNAYQKRANVRRREPRRHTLQNGIDYNMLKRMKKIEQEKDVLLQGLTAIEKARDWYLKQLERVQDKIRYLGRMGSHMEQWTEAQQERLELQRARVYELNRQLEGLAECWQRGGLSLHMNLALSPQHHNSNTTPSTQISKLQHQNHLLTEDATKKRERISVLEREKWSLIRELLQLRRQETKNDNLK